MFCDFQITGKIQKINSSFVFTKSLQSIKSQILVDLEDGTEPETLVMWFTNFQDFEDFIIKADTGLAFTFTGKGTVDTQSGQCGFFEVKKYLPQE